MDPVEPKVEPVTVDAEVIRKVSQENRLVVYRTIGIVICVAAVAMVVGYLFARSFENTRRIDRAICIEIQFLDGIPSGSPRIARLSRDLKEVARGCPEVSSRP